MNNIEDGWKITPKTVREEENLLNDISVKCYGELLLAITSWRCLKDGDDHYTFEMIRKGLNPAGGTSVCLQNGQNQVSHTSLCGGCVEEYLDYHSDE